MKKVFAIFAFCIIGLAGGYFFKLYSAPTPVEAPQPQPITSVAPSEIKEVHVVYEPIRISIPSLEVEAEVEHVGKDSEGRMDVPKKDENTAWYNRGPKPGEVGNAVIAGHLDTPTGAPSVFFKIDTLSEGDEIIVEDTEGAKYVYAVTEVTTYPTNEFPIQTVFGKNDKTRLNLITCGGVYDKNAKDYLNRTVVFSELQEVLSSSQNKRAT